MEPRWTAKKSKPITDADASKLLRDFIRDTSGADGFRTPTQRGVEKDIQNLYRSLQTSINMTQPKSK